MHLQSVICTVPFEPLIWEVKVRVTERFGWVLLQAPVLTRIQPKTIYTGFPVEAGSPEI